MVAIILQLCFFTGLLQSAPLNAELAQIEPGPSQNTAQQGIPQGNVGAQIPEDVPDFEGAPTLEEMDSEALSAAMSEQEIKDASAEALTIINAKNQTAADLQKYITALVTQYTGTALEQAVLNVKQSVSDLQNDLLTPETREAQLLLRTINSLSQSYDEKLAAFQRLDEIRESFEDGDAAGQIEYQQSEYEYCKNMGEILSPLWNDAKAKHTALTESNRDFQFQAANLERQFSAFALKNKASSFLTNHIATLSAGLADSRARAAADQQSAAIILSQTTGTRNTNDVKARLKLLTDLADSSRNFHITQMEYYRGELTYAEGLAAELSAINTEAEASFTVIQQKASELTAEIDQLILDFNGLRTNNAEPSMDVNLSNMLTGLEDLKNQLTADYNDSKSHRSKVQTSPTIRDAKEPIAKLREIKIKFESPNPPAHPATVDSYRKELTHYKSIVKIKPPEPKPTPQQTILSILQNQFELILNHFKKLAWPAFPAIEQPKKLKKK